MKWHYTLGGQVFGPVSGTELAALAGAGTIGADSLVWREGLTGWISYRQARDLPSESPLPAPATNENAPPVFAQSACVECGVVFPVETMVALGGGWMCAKCKPVYLQRLLQGTGVPAERMPSAGFWIRAGAKLLDLMFLGGALLVGCFVLAIVIGFIGAAQGGFQNAELSPQVAMVIGLSAIFGTGGVALLYAVLSGSATPGKRICGLRVVNREGLPIGRGRAAGRFLVEAAMLVIILFAEVALLTAFSPTDSPEVSMVITLLWPVLGSASYLTALLNPDRRGLHDLVCGTRVVVK